MVEERTIIRWADGQSSTQRDTVVQEARITVTLNGEPYAAVMAMPAELEELALGFLFGEGVFFTPSQVLNVRVNPRLHAVYATIQDPEITPSDPVRTLTSACGRALSRIAPSHEHQFPILRHVASHPLPEVLAALGEVTRASALFKRTGGVHTAALWSGGGIRWICDDVGRHNAVDKVIGHALRGQWPPGVDAMLISTGRLSTEIVLKAVRAGIPLLVSRSAPTGAAAHLADLYGLTLVGFARAGRCNVYAHPERLAF